ncbi:hypothetical protein V9T40_013114 [Parthenolecanium corni]|uniref:Rho GTPase-activating protein 7 n=1 Tax=Parthenolecanium corni TaxID=536013 RepID=A0AAN9Y5R7_9HEMI
MGNRVGAFFSERLDIDIDELCHMCARAPTRTTQIEAAEACKWLRAAGFPQYAQMYEDKQFPIDINSVQKDHQFLEPDALQSLFRRFRTLNRCANMKVELMPANKDDDSDSDTECALSEYWSFQRESRRWSRNRDVRQEIPPASEHLMNDDSYDSIANVLKNNTLPPFSISTPESDLTVSRFRRSGSERLRDGAKAFLRRVESLKSRRRKQKNREGVVISGPLIVDAPSMEARIKDLNCVDVTPPESPVTLEDSRRSSMRYLSKPDTDFSAFSDSEVTLRQSLAVNGRFSKTNVSLDVCDPSTKPSRCSSRSDSQDSQTFSQLSPPLKNDESSEMLFLSETDASMRPKISVVRWHSFQRNSARPNSLRGQSINSLTVGQIRVLRKLAMLKLTAVMEKYCPTHRTTGWNWELPKFIRKVKTPDYKDKSVFGVPLLTNAQQSGFVLPEYILEALDWLRSNALDQVGIFRKPGVRSRIHKLKILAEVRPARINFDGQQAYDVADMVKQYFRELPDALLTNKLSETFVAIFQYVPDNLRAEAVQRTLILLPDEHRDALLVLLSFLYEVAQHSYVNQMSASNLALCLAPSLFYWTHSSAIYHTRRSSSMSPKRLQKSGTFPDVKELGQNKAAHECLYYLIKNYRDLFTISEDTMSQCHFDYMDESVPVSLGELGEELQQDWRGYMNMCHNALSKEVKDKNRGWVISSVFEDVEIAYKKVRDGHPLRLWRVCAEVEAPPKDILYRILYERSVWDQMLYGSKIVHRLDQNTELFQYVTRGIGPLPQKDFCVIRSWQTDLSKDGCMVVETSVEHEDAQVIPGCVRGIVLASRYLIEPCGSGKSRILHLSRVDIKGRSSDWYNKCYGHVCARHLIKMRHSFQRMTEGPESKV